MFAVAFRVGHWRSVRAHEVLARKTLVNGQFTGPDASALHASDTQPEKAKSAWKQKQTGRNASGAIFSDEAAVPITKYDRPINREINVTVLIR